MREQIKKVVSWLIRLRAALPAFGIGLVSTSLLRLGTAQSLLIFLGISLFLWGMIEFFLPRRSVRRNNNFQTVQVPMEVVDLGQAEDYVDTHYEPHVIQYFFKVFTQLPDYLTRVDEDVRMAGRTAQSTSHLLFRVAEKMPVGGTLLAPIAWARKGRLFTDFRAFNHCGALVPTLSQWQVNGLIVVVVRTLFNRAVNNASLSVDDRLAVLRIVQLVIDPAARNHGERLAALGRLVDDLDDKFIPYWRGVIRDFCASLIDIYLVVAEVARPDGDGLVVGYSHTIVPELVGRRTRTRARHGLLPTELDVPNPLAFQAGSYHFEAFPSGDMYVYSQHMEELDSKLDMRVNQVVGDARRWYIRGNQDKGSPAAHLYVRRQGPGVVPGNSPRLNGASSEAGDVKSVIEFREVPPGALGNAVTAAFITALIVTFVAFFGTPGSGHDFLVLLLTLPAFLAAAIGRGMTADRLVTTSLTAYYGLWLVAATSLGAVLLSISGLGGEHLPWMVDLPWGREVNGVWILLALFSICVLLYLQKRKSEARRDYLDVRTSE
ncbi:hypothetical protein ACFQ1S_08805 [Kibdelosporangium lantanae]|uniref:Uncharacterized protein n=1 Tax=Kibdelosporangium lantanae TaxID=1497396 RepID=A0ABW3M6P6_9PSEU